MNKPAVRVIWVRALLALVLPMLFASAAPAAEPHPTLDQYKPKDPQAVIKAVSLGVSNRNALDPKRIATQFPDGVTHIVAWYRWDGAKTGHKMNIHWFHEGAKVLEQGNPLGKPAGAESWVLTTGGGPLPAGNYKVEFLENGRAVTAIPFRIGATAVVMLDQYKPKAASAAIKSVSLSASDNDEFDSKRVGTQFPAGVPRVVVYFVWEGAAKGLRVDARLYRDKSMILEKTLTLATPAGYGDFSAGPLAAGNYRVELLENGQPVTAIPFGISPKK